jgi:hypothetical protein
MRRIASRRTASIAPDEVARSLQLERRMSSNATSVNLIPKLSESVEHNKRYLTNVTNQTASNSIRPSRNACSNRHSAESQGQPVAFTLLQTKQSN